MDYVISATIKNEQVRAYAIDGTEMTKESQRIHNSLPVVTAAVGRVLNAVAMMSMMLKNDKDKISAQIKCHGPIESILVIGNTKGQLKADVLNPHVDLPLKDNDKLDVADAIGGGTLTIVKDFGLKNPTIGTVEIVSGEIAKDFTYYFVISEQTPSVVSLGVLVNPDGSVRRSGGFIIQLMPNYSEELVAFIEEKISTLESVTQLMEMGKTPEDILHLIFKEYEVNMNQKREITYHCDCNRQRFQRGILSLGREELRSIIEEDERAEVLCHFCGKEYTFTKENLEELLREIK
ncbi:MAG: Hsp33 family molecular chaperone HslO [Eubacteriales bacterium]